MSAVSALHRQLAGPLIRATLHTTGVLSARLLVQAAILLVLARMLGPAGFGGLAGLLSLAAFLGTLATFGTHLVLVRDLARDPNRRASVLPVVLGTTSFCGSLLLLAYMGAYFALLHRLELGLPTVLCIGIAEVVVQPLLSVSAAERLAAGRVARSQLLRMIPMPLQLATAVGLWRAGMGGQLRFYAVGHLVATLIALAVAVALQAAPWPSPRQWRLLGAAGWKDNSGFAFQALTASGPTELDKALAPRLLPLAMAGVYTVASRVNGALVIPVASLMIAALPRLFRESGDGLPQPALLRRMFGGSLLYGLAAATVVWLVAPIADVLFGTGFAGLSSAVRWFVIVMPALCLRMVAVNILMAVGHPWLRVGIELGGVALMVCLALLLASRGGVHGMVNAVVFAETSMALAAWSLILSCYRRTGRV